MQKSPQGGVTIPAHTVCEGEVQGCDAASWVRQLCQSSPVIVIGGMRTNDVDANAPGSGNQRRQHAGQSAGRPQHTDEAQVDLLQIRET